MDEPEDDLRDGQTHSAPAPQDANSSGRSTVYQSVSDPGSSTVPYDSRHSTGASSSSSEGESLSEGDHHAEEEAPFNFDRAATSRHAYLGDNLEDLERSQNLLVPGNSYTVPLFALEGIVLCPGDTLPMRLQHPVEQARIQRALQAAPPVTRLIVVACLLRTSGWLPGVPSVGCLAEVRQIRLQDDNSLSVLSRGCQRVALPPVEGMMDLSNVAVRVLEDLPTLRLPREAASLVSWWPPWAYRPFDAFQLAREAREMLGVVAPKVPPFHGDPLTFSYWLVSNLPLDDRTRQRLLEAKSAAGRLLMEVQLLREMGKVRCRRCRAQIGDLRDVVQMSEEGVSGCYVNPHGVVHDIHTLGKVRGVALEGSPQTESSWFPGYAWTIAYCRGCWHHLGWRFTSVVPGLKPACFWGLRRSAIQGATWRPEGDSSSEEGEEGSSGGSEEGGEDEGEGVFGAVVLADQSEPEA